MKMERSLVGEADGGGGFVEVEGLLVDFVFGWRRCAGAARDGWADDGGGFEDGGGLWWLEDTVGEDSIFQLFNF